MASRHNEADLFSSSPARPSHHRTQLPPKPKPATRPNLKRSASQAALLTPPSSPVKGRPRSNKHSFEDSEDEDEDEEMASPRGSRRMRNSRTAVKEQRAQARLGGPEPSIVLPKGRTRKAGSSSRSRTTAPAGGQANTMRLDSDDDLPGSPEQPTTPGGDIRMKGPVEPTTPTRPRRRQPASPAVTTRATRGRPMRDSPNNPFLGSSPRAPKAAVPFEEQPTMTYVFRGVKATFRNPAYGGPSTEEHERAKLRPEHPDFSPDLLTAPKLLFPSAMEPGSDDEAGPSKRVTRSRGSASPTRSKERPSKRRKVVHDPENIFA